MPYDCWSVMTNSKFGCFFGAAPSTSDTRSETAAAVHAAMNSLLVCLCRVGMSPPFFNLINSEF